ncbi:hypothetical protein SK128_024601 [Halocaridina rubra]|uniref:Uncharacterized protein n=1 Tax=Halocaridina rubra TaxID=373956 RepID=A0AAN9A1N0_HALRR
MAAIGISFSEFDHRPIRINDLWCMHPHIQNIINLERMYVLHADKVRYGKLALHLRKLCLHRFKEEKPPSHAYIVEYNEVMNLIDPNSRLAFLDISTRSAFIGRLYIRLSPNSEAAIQFMLLSLAELKHTYADTSLLHMWMHNKDREYIQFGDYELNTGQGGPGIVPGLANAGVYNKPWRAGTVWGFLNKSSVAGQFFILTRDIPREVLTAAAYGMVEDGFPALEKLARYCDGGCDITDIFIKDCGMVLNTSLFQ